MEPVLEMRGIYKRFPGVQALRDVNLKLFPGEIHSLIGQNGAGKSTLMKILSGNYRPNEGEILLNGKPVNISNTAEAAKLGIGIVYQELSLLNNLTVAENIFLGRELVHRGSLNNKGMREEAKKSLKELGIENIDIDQKVEVFPLAKKQLIEIAKVIYMKPKILILDEPTAALTTEDTTRLFKLLFRLKEQNIALVFISHRLGEVKKYCDRGTILMNGTVTANVMMQDVTEEQIIAKMLGEDYKSFFRKEKAEHARTTPVIEIKDLYYKKILNGVSVAVYPGEITGFTGLLGAGQDVLWRTVFGNIQPTSGEITVKGKRRQIKSPKEAVKLGIGLLTDNRKEEGLFEQLSVMDNIALPTLKRFKAVKFLPHINMRTVKKECMTYATAVNIVMKSIGTPIKFLSGGNQQKAILSRWLLKDLDILVFLEPTRGVDVGAKAEIYRLLASLAERGKTVVVISTDTSEILGLSDRIIVMNNGRVAGILEGGSEEETLLRIVQGKAAEA